MGWSNRFLTGGNAGMPAILGLSHFRCSRTKIKWRQFFSMGQPNLLNDNVFEPPIVSTRWNASRSGTIRQPPPKDNVSSPGS